MKKILIFALLMVFIPFFIVTYLEVNKLEEIELKYINNITVRVKRLKTGEIEEIPLEEYVVGVLAGEMPTSFCLEAFKAQAVASRTYVLKRMGYNKNNNYDVVDSVSNQVYLDLDYLKEVWGKGYTAKINKLRTAVNETIDEYLDYDGEVVEALFFSTSNGYTEDSNLVFNFKLPYLKSVESSWDKGVSSVFNASKTISLQEFYESLKMQYNPRLKIEIIERSNTNRILSLKINDKFFSGREIYNKLGLKSTDFEITQIGTNLLIETTGYGHGVGMSQYGAEGMAKAGYRYNDILKHYYTGTTIKKIQN